MWWPAGSGKWYERPIRCVVGLHRFRIHPSAYWWRVCEVCGGEKSVKK